MIKLDGYDEAILGSALARVADGRQEQVLVYDAEKIRAILMARDGMDSDGAREFIEFNIEGAYMGMGTPLLVWPEDMWNE
jgi:hypothetical protein